MVILFADYPFYVDAMHVNKSSFQLFQILFFNFCIKPMDKNGPTGIIVYYMNQFSLKAQYTLLLESCGVQLKVREARSALDEISNALHSR